jgi:hypothetical protein
MPSYAQQMIVFQRQVRTTSEVWLAKIRKKIESCKSKLKSPELDEDDKAFLEVYLSQLEREVKTYKELIAQTRRKT